MKLNPNLSTFYRRGNTVARLISGVVVALICLAFVSCGVQKKPRPEDLTNARTIAGFNREFGEPFGVAVKNDVIYVSDGQNGKILAVSPNGNVSAFVEGLDTPSAIAFDKNGDLFVADSGSNSIKKIDQTKKVVTIAGADGQAGFADGDAASARFNGPIGIAVGDDGSVYVSDTYDDRIRVIRNGLVSTLAGSGRGFADGNGSLAKFNTPCGLALMPDGNLLVADLGNRRLRLVQPDGLVTTLAGDGSGEFRDGLLSSAGLVAPSAMAIDPVGSIYVADGNSIRVIRAGVFPVIETIAGNRRGLKDGFARSAEFNRPSGLTLDSKRNVIIADSDNQLVRILSDSETGKAIIKEEKERLRVSAEEFRVAAPARWPYNQPNATREIAGTLGEIRGEIGPKNDLVWFHNGLDIAGSYGETARFVRDEKVLLPLAVENFGTLRELIRMPMLGYIHIRIGRDQTEKPFPDKRFQFDGIAKPTDVRVPRGTKFRAGEPIGTLNPMNHVHLIAGRSSAEMNALDALILPGISDNIPPTIEKVTLFDENWHQIETAPTNSRIKLAGKTRIVVRAYDRMDGNAERRRLGIYSAGYSVYKAGGEPVADRRDNIDFKRLPDDRSVPFVYALGSKSGATGETIFNYIATNDVNADSYKEDYMDLTRYDAGQYLLRVFVSDYFGNTATRDINFEVIK